MTAMGAMLVAGGFVTARLYADLSLLAGMTVLAGAFVRSCSERQSAARLISGGLLGTIYLLWLIGLLIKK